MIEHQYQARLAELRQVAAQRDQRHGQLAYLRLGLVVVVIAAFALAGWQGAPFALGAVAAFLIVAVYHARVIAARDRALAAAGLLILLAGAIVAHLRNGDRVREIAPALVLGVVTLSFLVLVVGDLR